MFTGLIQSIGEITELHRDNNDLRIRIDSRGLDMSVVELGDSIAVNGVCLTVVAFDNTSFRADVSAETLANTTLGNWASGQRVNMEKALTFSQPLGGHLVSGHVDGTGKILSREQDGRSVRFSIQAPGELEKYIARKGSICIDGTSLTVNAVVAGHFEINIVPHTLDQTIFQQYRPGVLVNLEVDLIARYLEQMLISSKDSKGVSLESLQQYGFVKPGSR
ncbi:MAG: riboflavin synthase [Pseudomonadales bacterium]|nr:riboflavin synthase [Pseudomonadales bacterium]